MIKELDILLDTVPVPEEHLSTDLHSLPLFVEAPYNSEIVEETTLTNENLMSVSPPSWVLQPIENSDWEDPFLINYNQIQNLRRYLFAALISSLHACGAHYDWTFMKKRTHVYIRAGLWMVLMRNLLKFMKILLKFDHVVDRTNQR